MGKNNDKVQKIKQYLNEHSGKIGHIYSSTYYSLIDRIEEDGYFPESMTGAYPGMFMRSVGSMASLLMETAQYQAIEAMLRFCIDGMKKYNMHRMPHFLNRIVKDKEGNLIEPDICKADQIDGQAHVIMAWARLAGVRDKNTFEDETYLTVKGLMDDCLDAPYFYFGTVGPYVCGDEKRIRLIHNSSLEHSRESRYWQAFDLLSQSFVGAAAEAMIKVAEGRGDIRSAKSWNECLNILIEGVKDNLTRTVGGTTVYLEMRLPDGWMGRPFLGMSWVNISPAAAQWEPLSGNILANTVRVMKEKLWVNDPLGKPLKCLMMEYDENANVTNEVLGKAVGWDLDFCRRTKDYGKILDWFDFLNGYHYTGVYMEGMKIVDGHWVIADAGNGEQASWWCWSIARLRKELGMNPVPERV